MIVDNTELIRNFIVDKFDSEDIFFFVQIMKRKKDDDSMDSYNRVIQSYYIHSLEDFDRKIGEIKQMCDMFNARAYINPNRKGFKKCALYMLKSLTDLIINEDYYHAKSVFNSVCGQHSEGDKYWIVDIDTKEENFINEVSNFIEELAPTDIKKVAIQVPTKNGLHLVTKPFNLFEFKKKYAGIDVHKDNPTLLYF